jgi:uncharacterized membrane protein YfcA
VTGLLASIFGSMVGLGGGFIVVPILRLFFRLGPAEAAGTSLALVVANSASGSLTYLLQKRVAVKIGLMIALGGFPGSILGAIAVRRIPGADWDWALALFLIVIGADLIWNRSHGLQSRTDVDVAQTQGMSHVAAGAAGFFVGFVSSLFGIGGGVLVVPLLLYFSQLPAHAIAATSQFAILLTSPVGLFTHALQGDIRIAYALPLVLGGLCGGPIGARLSGRLSAQQMRVLLAIALALAAGSLILRHFL